MARPKEPEVTLRRPVPKKEKEAEEVAESVPTPRLPAVVEERYELRA